MCYASSVAWSCNDVHGLFGQRPTAWDDANSKWIGKFGCFIATHWVSNLQSIQCFELNLTTFAYKAWSEVRHTILRQS